MKDKYYLGTIEISFCINAKNDEEVYEKIESQIPGWMDIDLVTITDEETHEEHLENYFDETKWEEKYYENKER